jgi:beta-phosphoglucomutase family hydrolase
VVPHWIELLAWVALALGFASALVVAGSIVAPGNRRHTGIMNLVSPTRNRSRLLERAAGAQPHASLRTASRRHGAGSARVRSLGLPATVRACLFDLDGVLTDTARIHAAAWKEMFDDYLRARAAENQAHFVPFDPVADYKEFVDGKPRDEGLRSFLASRRIELPEGSSSSPAAEASIVGLGKRKNEIVLSLIGEGGVKPYPGSVRYLQAAGAAGLRRAVVSSSENACEVLHAAGLADLVEARIDGITIAREHLRGKPAPDSFLAAARALGVGPDRAAVFEDALAGVVAGRAGRFALVVGVDRAGQADSLREHGADLVVADLADLLGRP